ncbi:MAG: hypothetical protein ACRDRX_14900 [Pseudonocardiaceae bacterium]
MNRKICHIKPAHHLVSAAEFGDNPVGCSVIGTRENQDHGEILISLTLDLILIFVIFLLSVNNDLSVFFLSVDGVGLGVLTTLGRCSSYPQRHPCQAHTKRSGPR